MSVGLRSKNSNRISGALQALASACAEEVAELFPFPHHGFFDLSPARMHLLGITLVSSRLDHIDLDRLTAVKWADAAGLVGEPPPTGIEGTLSRLPLPMWTADQYRDLLELFECRKAKKMLQHAEGIDPSLVRILVRLTPTLRTVRVTQHVRHHREAEVLCLQFLNSGDQLLTVRLDRIGRSLPHLLATVDALRQRGVTLRSLSEAIDTSSAASELTLHLFMSLAQFERSLIKERVSHGVQAARRRGRFGGRPRRMSNEAVDAARGLLAQASNPSSLPQQRSQSPVVG